MKNRVSELLGATVLGTLVLAGCSDQTVTGVATPSDAPARQVSGEMCEVIDFNGLGHGDAINTLSALGMNLSFSVTPSPHPWDPPVIPTALRAWDTDQEPAGWEDIDLLWKPGGRCAGCSGLGRIMIIEDERGFNPWGDSRYGGRIDITGFTGPGLRIASFKAVDDDSEEPDIRLVVGADTVGRSTGAGNGSVETVLTTPHTIGGSVSFYFGTMASDNVLGSGGVDDIRICRQQQEQTGGEGCTLGYWKQRHHHDSWTGYTTGQQLNTVFDFAGGASAFASLGGDSFLAALDYKGGPNATAAARLMLKQAVAALLNAASGDVDYAMTTADIVAEVNAALDTADRDTMLALAGRLDGFNNAGCPLN
ncbi:MAG TPA: hypothetical protein VHG51_03720 [Longimicrobiaceae bacterium]|nr:hypothetical protein [Longimicrobiaceae bacterium]